MSDTAFRELLARMDRAILAAQEINRRAAALESTLAEAARNPFADRAQERQ